MGYSYGTNYNTGYNALACDFCGTSNGTTKKMACPSNYCPRVATCSACRSEKKHLHTVEMKARCKTLSDEYKKREDEEQVMIENGIAMRRAALNQGGGVTRVFFSSCKRVLRAGEDQVKNPTEYYAEMPRETYKAIPLGTIATLEDYKRINSSNIRKVNVKSLYEKIQA